jgi:hypothetical protein
MFSSFWKSFKNQKSLEPAETSVSSDESIESLDFQEYEKYQGYMFIRSSNPDEDLNLDEYLNGNLDAHFKNALVLHKSIMFANPARPSFDPIYKIYPDLASLIKTRTSKADIGISDKGAVIICFDEPIESVYEKIRAGKFHEAISKTIDYYDPNITKFSIQMSKPKKKSTSHQLTP